MNPNHITILQVIYVLGATLGLVAAVGLWKEWTA